MKWNEMKHCPEQAGSAVLTGTCYTIKSIRLLLWDVNMNRLAASKWNKKAYPDCPGGWKHQINRMDRNGEQRVRTSQSTPPQYHVASPKANNDSVQNRRYNFIKDSKHQLLAVLVLISLISLCKHPLTQKMRDIAVGRGNHHHLWQPLREIKIRLSWRLVLFHTENDFML